MATLTFASCYFSTPVETINDPGVAVKANGLTTEVLLEGFEHANNRLTNVGVGRTYEVAFNGTVSTPSNADVVAVVGLRKNGFGTPGSWAGLEIGKAAAYGALSCATQVYLNTGDYVELWLTSQSGDNLQIEGGTITVNVIG